MCSHFESVRDRLRLKRHFQLDDVPEGGKQDMWPCYMGLFLRRHQFADVGDEAVPERESLLGSFGLIPHWAKDAKIGRQTYNARSETVAVKPSFRDAWKNAHHCIIPAEAIYEPDWRTGKAIPARISRADGAPMGIAGLWSVWRSPAGETLHSFTMLTINADRHPLMNQFHKPNDEKRMVVVLSENRYDDWLSADAKHAADFLSMYPAEALKAEVPAPRSKPAASD
ncbi:MAG: SOS response-associated peptidase [Rhodocyclaceae bacterium]|nr:SOS response-associated peptidase [Rhodocyclaceae bacterium]